MPEKFLGLCLVILCLVHMSAEVAVAAEKENRALRLLLEKGLITQEEYDKAKQEEESDKSTWLTKRGLQIKFGGFAEIDAYEDNRRGFQEIVGNRPVARPGTLDGQNSQFQMSPRNSRLTLDVRAPEQNGITSRFFVSMDFLGNQPPISSNPSSPAVSSTVSEFSNFASPTLRIFQLFFDGQTPFFDFKVGQDWTAFGFMSQYSRGQVSVAATPANMFNRWIQASVSKKIRVGDQFIVNPIFSVERPPQRDGTLPSFVAGVQVAFLGLQAPYTGASSADTGLKPMSFQISGVGRRFEANAQHASGGNNLNNQNDAFGWGGSASLFIPILPSRNGELGNTAHVVMEGVMGAGIADMFNGLSWGVCNPVCGFSNTNSGFGGAAFGQTNIDAGLAAVSAATHQFEAIRTRSMMVHANYYLPNDGRTWFGGGYGTVYSSNAREMTCTVSVAFCGGALRTAANIYNRESTYYGYLYHDFTRELRLGLELNWFRTTYADGVNAENRRAQLTMFYRF